MDLATAQLGITVPVSLPSAERMEEIFREECAKAAAQQMTTWLSFEAAAQYLGGMSFRTFERRKEEWGIPQSELTERSKMIYRPDLDALGISRIVKCPRPLCEQCEKEVIINFPSVELYDRLQERLKQGAA